MSKKKLLTKRNVSFFLLGLILAIFFAAWTLIVRTHQLRQFDFNMTVHIQDDVPRRFDPYFSVLSLLGSAEVISVVLFILLIVRRKLWGFFVSFFLFGSAHLTEIIGKSFLHQPPPPFMFHRYALGFQFPSSYVQPGSSYPSGHALRITFLGVIVTYFVFSSKKFPKYASYLALGGVLLVEALMLVSRVSLGEHWTTDVIGGSMLGTSFGFFSILFL